MLMLATLIGCGIEGPVPKTTNNTEVIALDTIDSGDGRTVSEFLAEELPRDLAIDWSFANLPAFAADTVEMTPDGLPTEGACQVGDDGAPESCTFELAVTVTSVSGLWGFQASCLLSDWRPGELTYDFSGDVPLSADQTSAIAAGLDADGIAFSDDTLFVDINRGSDGSGYGLPKGAQRNVLSVEGQDDNTGAGALFAADDTIDAE